MSSPAATAFEPASPADVVDGVSPRFRAAPRDADGVSSVLQQASADGLATIVKGGGSKLGWGMPPRKADLLLVTSGLDRIVEHAAGDLVVVAQAGVRLADLQARLAGASQRLSLDPPEAGATLGGIVAAAASGPRRHRFGAPRDLLLGITVALADGTLAKSGGKVVKNVAGYDLGKLFAGSLGTLGVIVELAVRLHPLPAARALVVATLDDAQAAARAVRAFSASQLEPSALELAANAAAKVRLGILFEGRPPGVASQAEAALRLLAPLGDAQRVEDLRVDAEFTSFDKDDASELPLLVQLSALPGELAALLESAFAIARERGVAARVWGRAGLGVLLAGFAQADAGVHAEIVGALRKRLEKRAHVVIRRASVEVKRRADVFGEPGDALALMKSVKQSFDPAGLLAPGRFVGGL